MTTTVIVPLQVYQGDTYSWLFTLWQDEARTVPVDLTGTTPKAEIRMRSGAPLLADLACDVQLPNEITMKLERDESLKLVQPHARWDLQLTLPDSSVTTIIAGPVTVTRAITESAA